MAQSRRPGKPPGPLAGDTPEAEELAQWVSKVTKGLTLRELEEQFQYGRTQWGQFRRGDKVLPSWLVDDLVKALITSPQDQRLHLGLGRELQKAAEAAAVAREAQSGVMPTGTEGELQIRLDEARKTTIEAQKTLLGATQIIYMLLGLVTSLQTRCQVLEQERDSATARAGAGEQAGVLAVVERELVQTKEKADLVEKKLGRARRTRHEAEDLHVAAEVTAVRHELALEKMRADAASVSDEQDPGADEADTTATDPSAVMEGLTPLWEYDAALEAVDQQIDAREAELDDLRTQMGIDKPEQDHDVLTGVVVHEQPADNEQELPDVGTTFGSPAVADADSAPGLTTEADERLAPWWRTKELFTPRPDGPWDISELPAHKRGRICLGPLYVPRIDGIRLHAGLEDGRPVGLIAEVEDHRCEIRLFPGSFTWGSWSGTYARAARRELEKYHVPIDTWYSTDHPLPLKGLALATRHGVITRTADSEKYQLIVMGCDGPGWVFQLTWYRPEQSTNDERVTTLLNTMLRQAVIDPARRQKSGAFLLDLAAQQKSRFSSSIKVPPPSPSPPPDTSSSMSALSADNADTPPTSENETSTHSVTTLHTSPQPQVRTPTWVLLKDIVLSVTLATWSTILASAFAHRRSDEMSASAALATSTLGLLALLMSFLLYGAALTAGHSGRNSANETRIPSGLHIGVIMIGLLAAVVGGVNGLTNPGFLPLLDSWGQALSRTLLT
ncbi:DUF3710 domain-containing protein [Streptomyces microflavus]|uniref:DUF3710 domain-containing protein n=1 Tax=Streptomyces microflavus TaxID=1919 RepID=UPI0038009F2E